MSGLTQLHLFLPSDVILIIQNHHLLVHGIAKAVPLGEGLELKCLVEGKADDLKVPLLREHVDDVEALGVELSLDLVHAHWHLLGVLLVCLDDLCSEGGAEEDKRQLLEGPHEDVHEENQEASEWKVFNSGCHSAIERWHVDLALV